MAQGRPPRAALDAKLALERRFQEPLDVKLALERRFWELLDVKLAWFWWQGRQGGQEGQARQAGAGLFWRRAGHLEQPWKPSWRWNDDFGSSWTSSWLWNSGFRDPWKSSWLWNGNFTIFLLFSCDFRQFRKACEPSEVPCLSAKTEVQPVVL